MTAKEMGERLYLDSGTLTPLLKKMEEKELLTRGRCVTDERSLQVSITEKGESLKQRAADIPLQIAKCTCLAPEEASCLYRILYKMLGQSEKNAKQAMQDIASSSVKEGVFTHLTVER